MKYTQEIATVHVFLAAFLIGGFLNSTNVEFFLLSQLLKLHFHLGLPLWSRRNLFKIWDFETIKARTVCRCVCRRRLLTQSLLGLALLYMNEQREDSGGI